VRGTHDNATHAARSARSARNAMRVLSRARTHRGCMGTQGSHQEGGCQGAGGLAGKQTSSTCSHAHAHKVAGRQAGRQAHAPAGKLATAAATGTHQDHQAGQERLACLHQRVGHGGGRGNREELTRGGVRLEHGHQLVRAGLLRRATGRASPRGGVGGTEGKRVDRERGGAGAANWKLRRLGMGEEGEGEGERGGGGLQRTWGLSRWIHRDGWPKAASSADASASLRGKPCSRNLLRRDAFMLAFRSCRISATGTSSAWGRGGGQPAAGHNHTFSIPRPSIAHAHGAIRTGRLVPSF
jgi:hypothetical protein